MSEPYSLWERLKRARIVQVLLVYLGASWAVLQIADVLVDALTLPPWVLPVAIILLLVGLVVILSTAWVQSLPSTTAREEAGELPTDWQIAPRDALSSLRAGRLPHLTWARAVAGGVVMLSLLFGGAGMYMGLTSGDRVPFGPTRASASEAAEGIAVVPFEVRGQDLEIWREGMMDLLTSSLDGVGGFRTIDSRTIMARWQRQVSEGQRVDLEGTLGVARSVGARYALVGSVVGLGSDVRLVANVHDLDTGREVATSQAQGPVEDVLRLVDELAVGTMRSLLLAIGRSGAGDLSAETITTSSLPALRAYLEGESHFRKGRFAEAVQSYENAVAADSTFAIALVRLSENYGWLERHNSARSLEVGRKALAQAHRLSPRYQFIMQGWEALNRGSADGLESLKEAVRKYPDDPGAWFLLAETYIHVGGATYGTEAELWDALQRATTLDPNFAPYLVHLAEFATLRGDRALAESTLARYEALTGNRLGLEPIELAIPLLLGSADEVAAAVKSAADMSDRTLSLYLGTFGRSHDRFSREAAIDSIFGTKSETSRVAFQGYYAGAMGHVQRGAEIMARPAVSALDRAIYWAYVHTLWSVQPPDAATARMLNPEACDVAGFNRICEVYVGAAMAQTGRWAEHGRVVARTRARIAQIEEGDPEGAERLRRDVDVLEGAAAWRRGDVRRGRELLQRHARTADVGGEQARLELAWLEAEAGRPDQALRHFRSLLEGWTRPIALYGVASMLEQLGQPKEALPHWTSLVTLTEGGADLPRIVEARQALARAAREPGSR
jgi:tetratricopeptide (TPR) repeat protein/TolB-like protein